MHAAPEPRKYAAVLDSDLWHMSKIAPPSGARAFGNRYFSVRMIGYGIRPHSAASYKVELICRKAYAWDECSVVWNFPWAKSASCFHDAAYQWAELLAELWGCTVKDVLAWADAVFLERMLQDASGRGARFMAHVYFVGVWIFGYRYHQIARFFRRISGRPLGIIKS